MSIRTWTVDVPANVAGLTDISPLKFGLQLPGGRDDKKEFTIVRPQGSALEINPPIVTYRPRDAENYASESFKKGVVVTKVEVICNFDDAGPSGKFYEVTLKLSQSDNAGTYVAQREGKYQLHYSQSTNAPVTLNFKPSTPSDIAPFNINPAPNA